VKLYVAAPLFSTPEHEWNAALTARLEAAGHEVFLPQAQQHVTNPTGDQIFRKDLEGLDWCDGVVAIMDGPDPDSGTAWECGYAYGVGKPIVLLRTDFRRPGDVRETPYNPMLVFSAAVHLELPLASLDTSAAAVLEALAGLPEA
jgi:nucleoside 2-deoxyribosyltransferase